MASEPIPNDPSGDELESLAEDLFGVNLNQDDDIEPFDVGDFDLDDDEPAEPTTPQSADETPAEVSVADAPVAAAADDDFGAMLLDEDTPAPHPKVVSKPAAPRPARKTAPVVDATEPAEQTAGDVPTQAAQTAADTQEDEYWDALEGFDWDEESENAKPTPTASKKYIETTETFEDLLESAEKTDEFLDDADFGAGLDEESESPAPPRSAAVDAETQTGDERKGRRRRGGRRRGRRGRSPDREGQDEAPVDAGEEETSERRTVSPKPRRTDDRKRLAAEDEDTDGFGAGLEVEARDADDNDDDAGTAEGGAEASEEDRPRKRRRRGGRRRGRRKREDQPLEDKPSAADNAGSDGDDADEEDSSVSSKQSPSREDKYRSVPTWEEAISYLVRREPKKSADGRRPSGSRRGRRGSKKQ